MTQTAPKAQTPRILVTIYSAAIEGLPDVLVEARTENGDLLASHISSNESWARHDIGLTSDWKHDAYRARYPGGYKLLEVALPADCQHEPAYPAGEGVTCSIRDPDRVAHGPTDRCAIGNPHAIAECGEFEPPVEGSRDGE